MADSGEMSPGSTTFGHQVGRDTRERADLASENFDLKLRIQRLEAVLKKKEQTSRRRRETAEGEHFYDYDDEQDMDTVSKKFLHEEAERYRSEIARLRADIEHAEAEAVATAAAAATAEKEAADADARVREAEREVRAEREALEDRESELQSANSKIALQSSVIEDMQAEMTRCEKAVALRVEGLQLQVHALEDAVEEARKDRTSVEAANRGLEEKLRRTNLKLMDAEARGGIHASDNAEVAADEATSCELIRLREELNTMSKRYDAISSNVDLKRRTAMAKATNPLEVNMENSELSVPGFELYERLCKKVRCGRRGSLVVLGEGRTREWRKVVLNEMNDSLVMLYRQSERLEDDRAQFIEKHCRFLLEREQRSILKERSGTSENEIIQ